jgi:hypothetical protein
LTPQDKTADRIQTLRNEIAALTQKQADAMGRATRVGMTPSEAKVFDARRLRIDALTKELAQLKSIQ